MLDIMTMAKNAIEAYNIQLRTTSSNIANVEVAGYKRLGVSFQTVFNRVMARGSAASSTTDLGGINPVQIGSGISVSSIDVDFSQGGIAGGQNLDLAVNGSGLLIVSPDGGDTFLYTRNGRLDIVNGNLVTKNGGMQVYGFDNSGNLVPITGLPTISKNAISWYTSGKLVLFSDSSTWVENPGADTDLGYRIAMTTFNNVSGLQQETGTTFSETPGSGPALTPMIADGTYGYISPRNYEQSNVFLPGETIDSLAAQRALNAAESVLKYINDAITGFINKLG